MLRRLLFCPALACGLALSEARGAVVFCEDFENGNTNGWTMDGEGAEGLTGDWIIGDPNGTFDPSTGQPAQPELAFAGAGCAFTAQNSSVGAHDVDEGAVFLVSPVLDLSGAPAATLTYERWFFNRTLGDDWRDGLTVDVRDGPASAWVEIERIGDDQSANTWTYRSVALEQFITLSATVQIRFQASDGAWPAAADIIEAAFDEVCVTTTYCMQNGDCSSGEYCDTNALCANYGSGDFDADGDVDLHDCGAFQSCFGRAGISQCAEANLAGDMNVTIEDYTEFATRLGGPF